MPLQIWEGRLPRFAISLLHGKPWSMDVQKLSTDDVCVTWARGPERWCRFTQALEFKKDGVHVALRWQS